MTLQRFVYHLYGQENTNDVNAARYEIFTKGKFSEDLLPPTLDVLQLHIRRANYQCYIWKHATRALLNMPDPVNHGWIINDESLAILWMTLPIAPDSILCFVNCSCKKGCSNARCSCRKASLQCSELCRCKECTNKAHGLPGSSSDSDDSSDDDDGAQVEFSDNENECSDCSDVDESANEPEVISEWETSIVYTETDTELSSLD